MKRFWIGVVLCVICAHGTQGAEPLTPSAQRALTVAQEAFSPAWAPCDDSVTTQVLMPGGTEPFGFHQIEPVTWSVEQVYLPFSNNGKPSTEKIYQVSAYTKRYRSWHGTWAPWNSGTAWEAGNIEIFNVRVTLPDTGAQTYASQYFVFMDGAFHAIAEVWNAAKQPPRHSTRNRTSLTGIFLSSCGIIKEMVMPSVFLSQ